MQASCFGRPIYPLSILVGYHKRSCLALAVSHLNGAVAVRALGRSQANWTRSRGRLVHLRWDTFSCARLLRRVPDAFLVCRRSLSILASIALITLFAAGIARLAAKGITDTKWVPIAALVCGVGTLMTLTWNQVQIYRDVETLWYDTLAKNPDCFLAHNNLGAILNRRGEFAEAQRHLKEALRVKPDFIDAIVNMGKAREGLQDVSPCNDLLSASA